MPGREAASGCLPGLHYPDQLVRGVLWALEDLDARLTRLESVHRAQHEQVVAGFSGATRRELDTRLGAALDQVAHWRRYYGHQRDALVAELVGAVGAVREREAERARSCTGAVG